MRRELEAIEIPGEHDARERTWHTLEAAFGERQPSQPSRARMLRPAVAIALAVAALAAVLSPPGRAVLDEIREVVGVKRAQEALFSLPAPGRLLVASDAGVWVVQQDGSKRLLGPYREASWSPFGRFVVAARENELAALEPDGEVRWTLARRGPRGPRWTGTETDTRIAYITTSRVHVVAGDGTGDADTGGPTARVAPAWQPGSDFTPTYVTTTGRVSGPWTNRPGPGWSRRFREPRKLEWSSDGQRLLLLTHERLVLFGTRSSAALAVRRDRLSDASFRPGSRELAVVRVRGGQSEVLLGDRVLFRGTGRFTDANWSTDGRWLMFAWPTADQWVFVRADGKRIRAVANVSDQFHSRSFPRIEGWCCER